MVIECADPAHCQQLADQINALTADLVYVSVVGFTAVWIAVILVWLWLSVRTDKPPPETGY